MNIVFFELEKWEKEIVKKQFKGNKITFFDKKLTKQSVKEIKNAEVLVPFIYNEINREIIDALPKLKFISTMSTGFDHIAVEYCKKKGIKVANVPTYGENTVAQHSFALILALSRKLFQSIERTHIDKKFETDSTLRGFDLKGRTLGVIGFGNIGEHIVEMAKGFELDVLVYTRHPDAKTAKKYGFKNVSFDQLLKKSDIISLHVPYNKNTHHMINDAAVKKMKKGVYVINTARGGLIDTTALLKGLKNKTIAGAGLDVLEEECDILEERQLLHKEFKKTCDYEVLLENHALMNMDNVIITPHNAFNSTGALNRILNTTVANVKEFNSKKRCKNCV